MRIVLVGDDSPTNAGLLSAFRRLGSEAELAPTEDVLRISRADDVLLRRPGPADVAAADRDALAALERGGVRVLNASASLRLCHDKLAAAERLLGAGVPHPQTSLLDEWSQAKVEPPLVLKPRFEGGGSDVHLCANAAELEKTVLSLSEQPWLRRGCAIVQELVPTGGQDFRVIVAGDCVVGAIRRIAPQGSWHTATGGGRSRARLTAESSSLALAAAAAVGGDLVGVDLVALWRRQTVIDVNGCVDFTDEYAFGSDTLTRAAAALLRAVAR